LNDYASDYIPLHDISGSTFENVENDAFVFLRDPPSKWVNIEDCIDFPCSAPKNVLMEFDKTTFSGSGENVMTSDFGSKFEIISDTKDVSDKFESCEFKEAWNAWKCSDDELGILVAIADDGDWEDRMVSPVWLTNDELGYSNKLNSMMDHIWDGVYTG